MQSPREPSASFSFRLALCLSYAPLSCSPLSHKTNAAETIQEIIGNWLIMENGNVSEEDVKFFCGNISKPQLTLGIQDGEGQVFLHGS